MQFSQLFVAFALAATAIATAIPEGPGQSFDETLAKVKLANPGISDDAAVISAKGFLDAVTHATSTPTRDLEKRGPCCKGCKNCTVAIFTLGGCCKE